MHEEFLNPKSLQAIITEKVVVGGYSYVDATLEFCEEADMEFEAVAKLLTDNLRQRIREEYVENGYLKAEAALPV